MGNGIKTAKWWANLDRHKEPPTTIPHMEESYSTIPLQEKEAKTPNDITFPKHLYNLT